MSRRVSLTGMGSARRLGLRSAALMGAMAFLVGIGLPSCQFPEYDLAPPGNGQAGTAAEAGAPTSGASSGGMAADGGAAGMGGAGGAGGDETEPDVACGTGMACTAALPAGWLGPVAYLRGNAAKPGEPASLPDCPDGYGDPSDLHTGILAAPAECSCSCTAKNQACDTAPSVSIFTDLGCQNGCFQASTLACTAVSGCNGSQGSLQVEAPAPSGTCAAKVTSRPLGAVTWQYDARLCSLETAEMGTCTGAGELCIPTPDRPYASRLCVFRVVPEGQDLPDCPASYPNARDALYESFADERRCSDCSCGGPTGGSCAGKLTLSNASSCTSSGFDYTLDSGCKSFSLASPPARLSAVQYTLTPGTCGIASDTGPIGGAIPSGSATAVCCR